MGGYNDLKTAIAALIRTNDNQEITGATLQSTLLSIINTIGQGSVFKGVATTSTNPGSPDANVFYIAGRPGYYPNFNLELTAGLHVIENKSGTWVNTEIVLDVVDAVNIGGAKHVKPSQAMIIALQSVEQIPDSEGRTNKMWWSTDGHLKYRQVNDVVYDLGNPAYVLYYCGDKIYKWTGSGFQKIGGGGTFASGEAVSNMTIFDDGSDTDNKSSAQLAAMIPSGAVIKSLLEIISSIETGGGAIAVFEGTKLVLKAAADLPMIRVSRGRINFPETEENNTRTATFVIKGKNLTGGITLALTDTSGMFSISQNSISAANANSETIITVTYAPTAIGNHSASIALSSGEASNTVELSGTAVEEIIPEININDNSSVTIAAENGNTATKSIAFGALHLQPNEQVALAIEGTNDITVTPATLTADENGSIDATLTLTYTAGSADASGMLVASCTTIARSTIGVTGHVAVRLSAGSYWDDGKFRYTVLTNTSRVSVARNPNTSINGFGVIKFPAKVSDEGKTVYDSGGNEVTASGMDYAVTEIPDNGFYGCYGISGLVFDADGLTYIGLNAFNMHPNGIMAKTGITFNRSLTIGQYAFFKFRLGVVTMHGNLNPTNTPVFSSSNFNTLDFCEEVTAIKLAMWAGTPDSDAKIIIRRMEGIPTTTGTLATSWTSTTLYVPADLVSAYQAHAEWGKITNILTIENDL